MTTKGRILIVDDIPTNVDILRRILRKDYELDTAASGEECLAKLPIFKPELVLLDIMMPGIDGYETCRRIKSSDLGEFIQVILVSGKGSPAERLQGYEAQADDYIVKPFNHEELLSKVRVLFRLGNTQRQLATAKEQLQVYANDLEQLVEAAHSPVGDDEGHGGRTYGGTDRGQPGIAKRSLSAPTCRRGIERQAVVLQKANTAALAALQAKSDFLANMSHEIRTPMTAILGYVDIMLEESIGPATREYAEVIKRNGAHLLALINDILDLSKVESGEATDRADTLLAAASGGGSRFLDARAGRSKATGASDRTGRPPAGNGSHRSACVSARCWSIWWATRSSSPTKAKSASPSGSPRIAVARVSAST